MRKLSLWFIKTNTLINKTHGVKKKEYPISDRMHGYFDDDFVNINTKLSSV